MARTSLRAVYSGGRRTAVRRVTTSHRRHASFRSGGKFSGSGARRRGQTRAHFFRPLVHEKTLPSGGLIFGRGGLKRQMVRQPRWPKGSGRRSGRWR